MRKNSGNKHQDSGYFLEYDRCIKQHHYSPKIYICVEENCQNKSLLCHYCINDSFHNYTKQIFCTSQEKHNECKITHNKHKVIPIEEYINLFRNLYYNGRHQSLQQATSQPHLQSPNSSQENIPLNQEFEASSTQKQQDWKENSLQQYLKYLKSLKDQISKVYSFVELQIKETEEMVLKSFQNLNQYEKDLDQCFSMFDNKEKASSSETVSEFVKNSFHFIIDSYSSKKCSKNGGGYLEMSEYNQYNIPFSLITQNDIQAKITQQYNHIKKLSNYLQQISNDVHKKLQNGLLATPFFESSVDQINQAINKKDTTNNPNSSSSMILNDTESSQTIPADSQSTIGSCSNISSNTQSNSSNLPENIFSIRVPSKKIQDIHTKSIWRLLHLYKTVCASCSSDGTIKIWNFKTQQIMKIFNSYNDAVNDLVYIPQLKLLVSVSGDNKIRVFSLVNYKCIRIIEGHLNAIYTCHYDHHKNILLSAGREEEIYGWNILTGERIFKTKSIQRSIYSLQSISSKDSFLCGDEGGSLTVFNYNNPTLIRNQTIHSKTIYSIKVIEIRNNNKDMQIATCSADGFIKITSFKTLELLNQVKLNSFVYDMSIHMNRIFAQIGKTQNLAIIGLTQQRGNIEVTTKIIGLNSPHKVRCLQIVKDQNILLYESTQNDINFDINIEQF